MGFKLIDFTILILAASPWRNGYSDKLRIVVSLVRILVGMLLNFFFRNFFQVFFWGKKIFNANRRKLPRKREKNGKNCIFRKYLVHENGIGGAKCNFSSLLLAPQEFPV